MTIGQRIAQKRKELELSQEALGERLGVSRQAIYKWESDASVPEIDKLVALSRLFGMTVGGLLGVEESAGPNGEPASAVAAVPEADAASGGEDLSKQQLRMVEEIVTRYLHAQPKKSTWGKWEKRIAFLCILLLSASIVTINGKINGLETRFVNMDSSVYGIQSSLSGQISGISNRVEAILKAQNDLTADCGTEISHVNPKEDRIVFEVYAVPKTYSAGMTAHFTADDGTGGIQNADAELGFGQKFSATVACRLTDSINLSVTLIAADGTRQTQLLENYSGLYASTLPFVQVNDYETTSDLTVSSDGKATFTGIYLTTRPGDSTVGAENAALEAAKVKTVRVGLFKNQTLVAWAETCAQPSFFHSDWEDSVFYRLPDSSVAVTANDRLCFAAVVTDEYGRELVCSAAPYRLDDTGRSLTLMDGFDRSADSGDWSY